jgi:hypothetical protein
LNDFHPILGDDGDNDSSSDNDDDYDIELLSRETREAYQIELDYYPRDSSSISMEISDGPTPTPISSPTPIPDEEQPTWVIEKIVSMLRSNGYYSLFKEMFDVDNLGLEIAENLPSITSDETVSATDDNELSLPSDVQSCEPALPIPPPSEPISIERLLENMHIFDAIPHPSSSAPHPNPNRGTGLRRYDSDK